MHGPGKEMLKSVSIATSIVSAPLANDTNGTGVDLQGYEAALVVFHLGSPGAQVVLSGSLKVDLKVEESDDNSSFTAVAAADLDGVFPTVDTNAEAGKCYAAGYKGTKRYLRGVWDVTGTHTTPLEGGCIVVRANPRIKPTTQGS